MDWKCERCGKELDFADTTLCDYCEGKKNDSLENDSEERNTFNLSSPDNILNKLFKDLNNKFDNVCRYKMKRVINDAFEKQKYACLKEQLSFLSKYLFNEDSEECDCETCKFVRQRVVKLKQELNQKPKTLPEKNTKIEVIDFKEDE